MGMSEARVSAAATSVGTTISLCVVTSVMPTASLLVLSRESKIAGVWIAAFLSVFNLSATADVLGTGDLVETAG